MRIAEMNEKFRAVGGNTSVRDLAEVVSGGSAEDFVADGTIARIIEESKQGFYDSRMSKNAVFVIMERCELKDGKVEPTGEAVQVSLSMFDRIATPYVKLADGTTAREAGKESVRADGTLVPDWKRAKNAKEFMTTHMGKAMKFTVKNTVNVRAWDRAAEGWSKTELREQKVYTTDWVN